MALLSPEQVAQYHEQGFLVLRAKEHNLVQAQDLKQWTDEIAAWPRVKGKWMPYDEITESGERQLFRTENFADYHDGYRQLLFGDALTGLLGQLTGDDMLLFKDKINYKLPGGNGFAAHIDSPAYDHISHQIEHTTVNMAIDAATPQNGCLEVVAGSHHRSGGASPVALVGSGGAITEEWCAAHEWTPVPLAPGDVLVFGSHLAHRSGPNGTGERRASLYATYSGRRDGEGLRARYYRHRRENFPPDHERDPEKDYRAGFETYGFAAPFTAHEVASKDRVPVEIPQSA